MSIAYAGMYPEQIMGVLNFVGGWVSDRASAAGEINGTLFRRGGKFPGLTLWLYGRDDPFYSVLHSRENLGGFRDAGGSGRFLEFDVQGGNGHFVHLHSQLWSGSVGDYLNSLAADESG